MSQLLLEQSQYTELSRLLQHLRFFTFMKWVYSRSYAMFEVQRGVALVVLLKEEVVRFPVDDASALQEIITVAIPVGGQSCMALATG